MDWNKFAEYGFGGIVSAVLLGFVWRLLTWVTTFVKEQASQQANEREAWRKKDEVFIALIGSLKSSIDLHNQHSMDAHTSLKEGLGYQRQEHEKMISQLNEITVTLGRINGYKDEHKKS